ncbi:MAG: hypothetical protein K2N44_08980 [Lachnospiraceae bacterium]|nr:hypothetical protein [Lachnospiraceae bacterium]MDE7416420.1 hypothetical protein [Lachnospiraceae bacterium]
MEIQNNNDFKYVIQDTNCVYFGKELTYAEMMDKDDIPFKFKAIISAHIARDTDLNRKMADHILQISDQEFSYRIFEQLKLTVRVCYKVQKKGFGGKIKDKWVHKACSFKQFCNEYRSQAANGDMMIEDFSISKLALMALSI